MQKFEPFQKVLVRTDVISKWTVNLYSHYNADTGTHACSGGTWGNCIPYEGNEHLVGTRDDPAEQVPKSCTYEWGDKIKFTLTMDDSLMDGIYIKPYRGKDHMVIDKNGTTFAIRDEFLFPA